MTQAHEFAPGLFVRGFVPPKSLADFRLLAFGMDAALLYPGAEELVDACKAAGMHTEMGLGECADADAKQALLNATCTALGITPAQALVIGNAASDIPVLQMAGLGVAYRGAPAVTDAAMVCIQSGGLDRVLELLTRYSATPSVGLDLSVLDALVEHDAAKFHKFAQLFMHSVEGVMAEVDTAIAQGDMAKLAAMGHRAKSTALSIGATEFANQCIAMEKAARAHEVASALEIGRSLRPLFASIGRALAQRQNG